MQYMYETIFLRDSNMETVSTSKSRNEMRNESQVLNLLTTGSAISSHCDFLSDKRRYHSCYTKFDLPCNYKMMETIIILIIYIKVFMASKTFIVSRKFKTSNVDLPSTAGKSRLSFLGLAAMARLLSWSTMSSRGYASLTSSIVQVFSKPSLTWG